MSCCLVSGQLNCPYTEFRLERKKSPPTFPSYHLSCPCFRASFSLHHSKNFHSISFLHLFSLIHFTALSVSFFHFLISHSKPSLLLLTFSTQTHLPCDMLAWSTQHSYLLSHHTFSSIYYSFSFKDIPFVLFLHPPFIPVSI